MPSIAHLPALGPFGRVVDVRLFPHGFTTQQADNAAGPAGSAVVRPNLESNAWHSASGQKYGGNIVWTGSTPRHTVAYNGPRGRYFGAVDALSGATYRRCFAGWFGYNGARINAPTGHRVLGAAVKVYADLPTSSSYAGSGDAALTLEVPATSPAAITGQYRVRCTVGGTVGAQFLVTDPNSVPLGTVTAALLPVLFDSALRFTLTAGSVPSVVGDEWLIDVDERTQLLLISTVMGGTGANTTPRTEYLWRAGVSLAPGVTWRPLATLAAPASQVGGTYQPWFFNADASRAVTVRGLGTGADGYTLGVLGRSLNLDTLGVTDTPETSTPARFVETHTVLGLVGGGGPYAAQAGDVLVTNASVTPDPDPAVQLLALDYAGNDLVRIEAEFVAHCDGSSHMFVGGGASNDFSDNQYNIDLSGAYDAHLDLIWRRAGSEVLRLELFDLAATGSWSETWPVSGPAVIDGSVSAAYRHRVLRDLADPLGATQSWTLYTGTVSTTYDPDTAVYNQSASGVTLQHSVAGSVVATTTGGSGPVAVGPEALYWAMLRKWPGTEPDSAPPVVYGIAGLLSAAPGWDAGLGLSLGGPGPPFAVALSASTLPAVAASTGKGFQTSAADDRGNWLMAAEIAAFGADRRWPGAFTASGTYTLKAGGPDSLTPAQVHSLTGHPGADLWNVGAF